MRREAVKTTIVKPVKELKLGAEVYVVGAEGRLAILSDIDVLLCVRSHLSSEEV